MRVDSREGRDGTRAATAALADEQKGIPMSVNIVTKGRTARAGIYRAAQYHDQWVASELAGMMPAGGTMIRDLRVLVTPTRRLRLGLAAVSEALEDKLPLLSSMGLVTVDFAEAATDQALIDDSPRIEFEQNVSSGASVYGTDACAYVLARVGPPIDQTCAGEYIVGVANVQNSYMLVVQGAVSASFGSWTIADSTVAAMSQSS
jgi:hypothetical protein